MKKIISFVLAAAMSAMVAVPAFAAAPEADTVKDDGANTWTTSGQSDDFKDKMMTMVAYAPDTDGTITVDSIQYIDQTTADNTGAYSFDSYIPKNLPTEGDYAVKVGSEARDSAIDAGTIEQIESVDVPVTGTITTLGGDATISFCQTGTTEPVASVETDGGAYTINVAPGTYDVIFSRNGYLKYTITNVVVTETMGLAGVSLVAGDVDNNDIINVDDLTAIISGFGNEDDDTLDLDANGIVNIDDLTSTISNFGIASTEIDYSELN